MLNKQKENLQAPVDSQLVKAALNNDQAALALLVKRHLKLVYNIAYGYVKNSDDAQDIAQETFVKVWKNLKKFQPEKKFTNWLFEITKNTALDWLKKKKAAPFSNFENKFGQNPLSRTIADTALTPDKLLIQTETNANLKSALARLPLIYQETINSYQEQDLTFAEIADKTKQSINTVKSRYRRALILLKKFLG